MHVVIVVPCYNEEHRLQPDQFRTVAVDGHRVDFCFVDDGSTDGTYALLESVRAKDPERIAVLKLERNSGKAEAVRRGFLASFDKRPDLIGFWDADLATPFSQLPLFLDVLKNRPEIEMVFGARVRLLGREISRNPGRHYFGRVGATLISNTLGLAIYDTQCGAKVFRATDDLRDVFSQPFLSRWIFDVEIIARFVKRWGRNRAAVAIFELPIMVWRDVHGSKVKGKDFVRALRDLWKIRRAYPPAMTDER